MVLSANNSCSSINPPFPFEALVRGGPSPISCPRDHRFEDRDTVPTQSAPTLPKTTVERRSQSISGGPRRHALTCTKTPQQFLWCTCVPSKHNFQNWNGQIEKITPLPGKDWTVSLVLPQSRSRVHKATLEGKHPVPYKHSVLNNSNVTTLGTRLNCNRVMWSVTACSIWKLLEFILYPYQSPQNLRVAIPIPGVDQHWSSEYAVSIDRWLKCS